MSSIMRARSGLMGRGAVSEVIGGSSPELKVAGPSMLGIGCPDRHALPHITFSKMRRLRRVLPPARAGSFSDPFRTFGSAHEKGRGEPGPSTPGSIQPYVATLTAFPAS